MNNGIYVYALWGVIGGMVTGLVPLIFGVVRKKARLGITGFIVCTVAGAFLGLLLAIPVAAFFIVRIGRHPAAVPSSEQRPEQKKAA